MRQENIRILNETLQICSQGSYEVHDRKKMLTFSLEEMKAVQVFMPEDLEKLKDFSDFPHMVNPDLCGHSCENMDSFSMARRVAARRCCLTGKKERLPILVLNFANAFRPGGGVRHGATAQEEDLCRKSSLLLSLESKEAAPFYAYHQRLDSALASNAILISPNVEIIRDEKGELLENPVSVSVMTCAAPDIREGLHGLTQKKYEKLFYERIQAMLRCAAYIGARFLVLGAFGCGVFANDPRLVSDLFYKALKEFDFDGMKEKDMFHRVDFAVLTKNANSPNYQEFQRNFGDDHFYHNEELTKEQRVHLEKGRKEKYLDQIMGSLVGGAVGDALGYPVEFRSRDQILRKFGKQGITSYALDSQTGKALISDDTQMTLFTADGILIGETRLCLRGIGGQPSGYVPFSYQDWLTTQKIPFAEGRNLERYNGKGGMSWLLDVPELYALRAPGNTCLSALEMRRQSKNDRQYLEHPINDSKGCGGIMRVAPLGIFYEDVAMDALDREGAVLAAVTHGHSLGYMPAAVLTHVLNRIVYPKERKMSLEEIIAESREAVSRIFKGDRNLKKLLELMDLSVKLSKNQAPDHENIQRLGEGWVAEETLAIALYCALRYEHDFSAGVTAAVNITGDSDSTGAVTGNILGAINGYDAMEEKWKQNLELLPVLREMAMDLCHGCQMSEYSSYKDPKWVCKYIEMHWKEETKITWFWHEDGENGYLSNAYSCKFVIDDFCYRHVEQYLMAQKAKLFHDSEMYTAILRADTPGQCKKLGRQVMGFEETVWNHKRMEILTTGLRAKFTQNEDLRRKLMETGKTKLVKASPYDAIYGIKMTAQQAEGLEESQWKGKNLLGIALMEIRSEFL